MPADNRSSQLQAARRTLAAITPIEIKLLSLQYGLTQGQVRGLLMKCGNDLAKFKAAAERLRNR
jgi:hypothetical protein